jgi:hypothetical protein
VALLAGRQRAGDVGASGGGCGRRRPFIGRPTLAASKPGRSGSAYVTEPISVAPYSWLTVTPNRARNASATPRGSGPPAE